MVAGAGFGYENQFFEISNNPQNTLKACKTTSNKPISKPSNSDTIDLAQSNGFWKRHTSSSAGDYGKV